MRRQISTLAVVVLCCGWLPHHSTSAQQPPPVPGQTPAPAPRPVTEPCPGGTRLVDHTFSECYADGLWHVVTDRTLQCPDGSQPIVRVFDQATDQPCVDQPFDPKAKPRRREITRQDFRRLDGGDRAVPADNPPFLTFRECVGGFWVYFEHQMWRTEGGQIKIDFSRPRSVLSTREPCEEESRIKPTQTGSLILKPEIYGPLAGAAVVGGVLLGRGGDGKTASVLAPTVSPPTVGVAPPSSPPASPPPTPTPSIGSPAGTHNLTGCAVGEDRANHNSTLQFCQRVPQLIVSSPTAGAMSVLGAAPFLAVSGSYNTTAGEFNLTATGTVAGFPNVLVRFRGIIDARGNVTNGMVIFGENGALPGGLPGTYLFNTMRNQ